MYHIGLEQDLPIVVVTGARISSGAPVTLPLE
jgi:hypothetical protein